MNKCNPGIRPGQNDKSTEAGKMPNKPGGGEQKSKSTLGNWHGKKK